VVQQNAMLQLSHLLRLLMMICDLTILQQQFPPRFFQCLMAAVSS